MLRRLGRSLLGVAYISSGVDALRDVDRRAAAAEQLGLPEPLLVTRSVAGVQIGAGLLLILGKFPRLAAFLLSLAAVPAAATGHGFWTEKDHDTRLAQRGMFIRDLGLMGGALVATADTGGRESVPHHAARVAHTTAAKARSSVSHT